MSAADQLDKDFVSMMKNGNFNIVNGDSPPEKSNQSQLSQTQPAAGQVAGNNVSQNSQIASPDTGTQPGVPPQTPSTQASPVQASPTPTTPQAVPNSQPEIQQSASSGTGNNGGELDPDIASLLDDADESTVADVAGTSGSEGDNFIPDSEGGESAHLTIGGDFYNKVIEGEDEFSGRLTEQIDKALNAELKEDRTIFRQRVVATYWNFMGNILKYVGPELSVEKRMAMRCGVLDINFLEPEQQNNIKKFMVNTATENPFYYVDEWFEAIIRGEVKPSMVDEVSKKKDDDQSARDKMDRKQGTKEAELASLRSKLQQRKMVENGIVSRSELIARHEQVPGYSDLEAEYTKDQRDSIAEVFNDMQKLKYLDKVISQGFIALRRADSEIEEMKTKLGSLSDRVIDDTVLRDESNSIRQMIKMTVGPQGNHFPILLKEYMPYEEERLAIKQSLINIVQEIEKIDSEVFVREFKREKHRIVPFIILVPCFGESGICWEPFDTANRATSRGRIAIPMYPRNIKISVLRALADLRWQVAKEKASYHWMEEGLTGKYYVYFMDNKIKGNIKDEFISDYIKWITMEYKGTQKLHRDVRGVFWRYIPFPQEKKEELKNRGYFYADLYQRDERRSMSDGY